jgi:signal transduction histidine kinase
MNEMFMEITEDRDESTVCELCVQVLSLLEKSKDSRGQSRDQSEGKGGEGAIGERACSDVPRGRRGSNGREEGSAGSRGAELVESDSKSVLFPRRRDWTSTGSLNAYKTSTVHPSKSKNANTNTPEGDNIRHANSNIHVGNNSKQPSGPSLNAAMNRRLSSLAGRDHESLNKVEMNQSTADDDMYDFFLNFQSADLRQSYVSFKRSDGHSSLQVFVMAILCLLAATWLWLERNEGYNPTVIATICCGTVNLWLVACAIFLKLSFVSLTYNIRILKRFHEPTVRFYRSPFGQYLDDGIVVTAAVTTGLYIVSQALAPACPPGAAFFGTQACNPGKSVGLLPPEAVALALTIVIMFQILARGVSRLGLVYAWCVMIATINVSLWLVGSQSYLWINGELAIAMAISYELERMPLRHFIKSVRVVEASEVNAHLRVAVVQYQVRESELALEAKRSMVRHIGHEIRNPLNVIGVGTDVLSKELKRLGPVVPSVVLEVVEGLQGASGTALEVVNELLMFEKLAAGMTTIETAPTRIVRFIEMAMKQHLIPARAKEIDFKLTVEPCDNHVGVNIDPVKMTVVFRNLFRYNPQSAALA